MNDENFKIQSRGTQSVGKQENKIPDMSTETIDYQHWIFLFIVIVSLIIYAASIVYKFIIKRLTKRNMRKNIDDRNREA